MAEKEKILVVDDEEDIVELVDYNLSREGYRVISAFDGEQCIALAIGQSPDLIVLDLMLPGIDGLEVTKILKREERTEHIPIIMLTAKGEEADIVTGLELGADDYITKPFSPRVLVARVKSVLRRTKNKLRQGDGVFQVHGIQIDTRRHQVFVNGSPLNLTLTEFEILRFLAKKPGWVFTRYQIVDAVHGQDYAVTERAVDVQIAGLRKKLGPYGKYIETVRGIGYRLKE